jgi:hypothetical protein
MSDLIVLVPDKNMEAALKGILCRHESLGIRRIDPFMLVHPGRDSGCLKHGHELLRQFSRRYRHALILFDREGCGQEDESREALEVLVEGQLQSSGWDDRARAIVIDPELEIWVWSDSSHIPAALGWKGDLPALRRWLSDHHLWTEGGPKPDDPKEAVERILRINKRPRSSSIYAELAGKVSLKRCQDAAFFKLKETLVGWFRG